MPVIGFVISWAFAAAVNLNKNWTKQLDGFRKSRIGYKGGDAAAEEDKKQSEEQGGRSSGDEKKNGAVTHVEV